MDYSCSSLPEHIRVDEEFTAHAVLSEDLPEAIEFDRLESASEDFMVGGGGTFRGVQEGSVGLLAIATDGTVVDYTTLQFHEADGFFLEDLECRDSACGMDVRDVPEAFVPHRTLRLSVHIGGDGFPLAPEPQFTFTNLTPERLTLEDRRSGFIDLHTAGEEEVRFEIQGGGFTEVIALTPYVAPDPGGTDDGGSDDGDGDDCDEHEDMDTGGTGGEAETGGETGNDDAGTGGDESGTAGDGDSGGGTGSDDEPGTGTAGDTGSGDDCNEEEPSGPPVQHPPPPGGVDPGPTDPSED